MKKNIYSRMRKTVRRGGTEETCQLSTAFIRVSRARQVAMSPANVQGVIEGSRYFWIFGKLHVRFLENIPKLKFSTGKYPSIKKRKLENIPSYLWVRKYHKLLPLNVKYLCLFHASYGMLFWWFPLGTARQNSWHGGGGGGVDDIRVGLAFRMHTLYQTLWSPSKVRTSILQMESGTYQKHFNKRYLRS